jgi:two-component system OmpR family sensor kinase
VLSRLSLRARLVLGVMLLAALGLAAADLATYASLRSFLIKRTNAALDVGHVGAVQALQRPQGGGPQQLGPGSDVTYVQIRTLSGKIVASRSTPQLRENGEVEDPPLLPAKIVLPAANGHGESRIYFSVPDRDGDDRYQVRASAGDPNSPGLVTIVATSLSSVDGTLHRLLLIELLVTLAVLGAITALGLWVVRIGLRPLAAIGGTAAAIAAGDLTRRVERAEDRTEVGRLGLALNAMLAQIEAAFRAREASEQRLRRFVADASHELRTPLAAVRAYAELFTRGASTRPDDLARSMRGIGRESERMSVLVEDLLLLARLDEGRPLEVERVDLHDLILEAVETAQMVEPERPIEVELGQAVVMGDRDRLRQIVDNLLSNVRAHTPPLSPARVTLSQVDGNARIEVGDTGPGIGDEQLAHLFERFYRADESRARASGGVGLGLSIVSAVVAAHGGTVSVESIPGEGATFRIDLPLSPTTHSPSSGASQAGGAE